MPSVSPQAAQNLPTVLAVDDELSVRQAYGFILGKEYRVLSAGRGSDALAILDQDHVDLILLDMVMPEMHGLDFLSEVRSRGLTVPVVVVTASTSTGVAVEALKRGACEYLSKPFDVHQLASVVERTLRDSKARRELSLLRRAAVKGLDAVVGDSPAMLAVLARAHEAAQSDVPVLLAGENGSGKSLLAQGIHAAGPRAAEPFVTVACCGAGPEEVERDLLGSAGGLVPGAEGRLQVADRGTLYLDEVAELTPAVQGVVLSVLEEGQYRPLGNGRPVRAQVRLLCATNRNLEDRVRQGLFLDELYRRIAGLRIDVPPLRDRLEDLPGLVAHFLERYAVRAGARTRAVSSAALELLAAHPWPGNVRELECVVHLALAHHGDVATLEPGHLAAVLPRG